MHCSLCQWLEHFFGLPICMCVSDLLTTPKKKRKKKRKVSTSGSSKGAAKTDAEDVAKSGAEGAAKTGVEGTAKSGAKAKTKTGVEGAAEAGADDAAINTGKTSHFVKYTTCLRQNSYLITFHCDLLSRVNGRNIFWFTNMSVSFRSADYAKEEAQKEAQSFHLG